MWTLVFDTASPRPGLGLLCQKPAGKELYFERPLGPGSAELIPAALSELLALSNLEPAEINRIGVVTGPGSFTGIRAGLAFARGLSRSLGVPLIAIGTFAAAAAATPVPAGGVLVLEAGRGEVYADETLPPGEANPRTVKREEVVGLCESQHRPIIEIGTFSLLRGAAGLVASSDPSRAALAPMYGRPSAAEERFGPPEPRK
ncbi:MAG: tRNA (adenosine(37)-N6)-threonylcarbamoyltransferase complex dimerization subunit type 1 TsaB [Thermoanaerobaculia bacterium]|nr:tRNA (adenosine(37)-N6)-threonylcarbamoyltransferase complex dimerization subunit type 1 TsaB [Thermoanaerobaculia bacterium]